MRKLTLMIAVGAAATFGGWSTASAATLSIPLDTSISGGLAVGDETELATVATADLAGSTCAVRSVRGDRTAVNQGNDLIVTSGEQSATLSDVEREPGAVTEGEPIVLGDTITVVLEMGPDEAFASGLDIEFDCDAAPVGVAGEPGSAPANAPASTADAETDVLPDTGGSAHSAAQLGGLLIAAGIALRLLARRPSRA